MKIEIKGVEFSNKGAELMLYSVIQMLDSHYDNYELVLKPGHLLPYQKRAKLGAWQKFAFNVFGLDWTWLGNWLPGPATRLLRHYGIVVEKDIDVVLDASGFVYSDKWGSRRLQDTVNQLKRITRHHHRYVFLPQAFGPFSTVKSTALMAQAIKHARLVISRDEDSYLSLKPLDGMNKVQCYPDFTVLLEVSEVELPPGLPEEYVCIIPNQKMFGDKTSASRERYLQFLSEAILAVQRLGLTAVLVNHEGKKDLKICTILIERLPNKPMLLDGLDALAVKKVIGQSVFTLSSRFHGCVSGLSQGVPTLATSWSHKYGQLYGFYNSRGLLIGLDDSARLKDMMSDIISQRSLLSEGLLILADIHKQKTQQMWQVVFDKL
jgi:polysaccharide pyruvyl transferase WcaK-like protein